MIFRRLGFSTSSPLLLVWPLSNQVKVLLTSTQFHEEDDCIKFSQSRICNRTRSPYIVVSSRLYVAARKKARRMQGINF